MDEGNAFRRSQAIPVGRVRKRSERIMKKYAFSKFTNDPSNPVLIDVDVSSSVSKRSESVPKKKLTSEPISIQISSDYAVKSSAPGKRGQNPIKKDEVAKKFVNLETPSVSVSTAKHKHVSQQSSIPVSVPSKFGRRLHPHLSRTKKPTLTMETRSSVPDKKKHASQIKAKSSAPQSDSDFEAPAPVMQPKKRKAGPVSKAQKKRKYVKKQIHAENSSKDFILFRTSPQILFHTLHSLSKAQRDYVISIGLGPLLNMIVDGIPTSIGYYAVKNFDVDKMVLNVNRGQLPVNREVVHQLLGLPLGTIDLYTMPFTPEGDTTFHDFDAQFANEKDIRPKAVQRAILRSREVDSMFKVNLFVLICNTLGQSMSMGTCDLTVLTKAHKNLDLTNFDWCTFVIRCLKNTVPAWNPNTKNGYFYGPITLLSLLYLEGIRFDAIHLDRGLPAICYWNSATMKVREEMEQKTIRFGMGELQIPFTPVSESDPDENSDIQNIEHFTSSIGLKYSKILDLKHIVEAELADGLSKFPGAFRILSLATKLNQLFHEGCPKSDCTCRADASPEDVPLSQWWTDPDNLNAVEMSMVLASSGSKNFQNSPIATRAFGLSAEFESVLHHNPHAHIPSPIPLSVYDNREEAHGDDQKLKRHVNKPLASRSPFAQRTVDINKSISSKETIISEWLFSITDDPNEIVFDTAEGVTAQRYHLESLFKRCEVFAHVIDIWSYLLNLLEEIHGPHSPSRFFCNTTVTSLYLENEIMPLNERKQLFMSNILHCIADADTTLRYFHLVFLPVVRNAHIYLFVLDLKTPDFVIVDNMKVVESISVAYGLLPNLVTNCFADYMRSVNHPMSEAFSQVVPRILDMSWRTTDNHTDCGIFTMRHMETYMGPSQRDFKSGFKNESRQQQLQLDKLRMKYAYAILTSNSNKLKKTVELKAAESNKVDPDEQKLLREAASQNIKSRLRRFG